MPWRLKPAFRPEGSKRALSTPHSSHTALSPMDAQLKQRIETLISSSPVFVFMKGTKLMPQCGFSNNVVQILHAVGVPFETFDVLSDMDIRQGIKEFSEWPTIPQVYVKGEFVGGSDILIQLYNSGELREKLTVALGS